MAPRETENNTYAKFWGDKQGALWYVVVFSEVVSWVIYIGMPVVWTEGGRSDGRTVTRISRINGLSNFLRYGAPLARAHGDPL